MNNLCDRKLRQKGCTKVDVHHREPMDLKLPVVSCFGDCEMCRVWSKDRGSCNGFPNLPSAMYWHCRLCAELKTCEAVLDLDSDETKYKDLLVKLAFLNAVYVDITDRSVLPKTVCLECYTALDKAYEFLLKVQKAQGVLTDLFPQNDIKLEDFINHSGQFPLTMEHPKLTTTSGDPNTSRMLVEGKASVANHEALVTEVVVDVDPIMCVNEMVDGQSIKKEPLVEDSSSQLRQLLTDKHTSEKNIRMWKDYRWTCGLCYSELPEVNMLRSHSIAVHGKCALYCCFVCQKVDTFNDFVSHAKVHHYTLINRCHYCDTILDPADLVVHVEEHLRCMQSCQTCGEIFPNATALQKHLDSVKPKKLKRKPKDRTAEKDRTCPICSKVFQYVCKLKSHMETHQSMRNRDFACELCGHTFYTKGTLALHLKSHTTETPFTCDTCHMSFKQKRTLTSHLKTHSNIKPFSCETCGRSFPYVSRLNKHKLIHTDTFPYVCQHCNKGFHFKNCMQRHERKHTGYKPYSCDECDRTFADWGNYNKHMKRRHNRDMSKKIKLHGHRMP